MKEPHNVLANPKTATAPPKGDKPTTATRIPENTWPGKGLPGTASVPHGTAHTDTPERFHSRFHSDEPFRPVRLIRKKDLPAYCGVQRTVLETMIANGEFPRPIKLNDSGRAIAWLESEIAMWQQQRIFKRDNDDAANNLSKVEG
ncbi:MAG: AlpA family phage regulatory protein [Xanthobacteraceae bacterium]